MRWAAIAVLGVAACGRFGFEDVPSGGGSDGTSPDAATQGTPDAGESLVTCTSSPTNLGNVSGTNHDIDVISTPTGFIALTTDNSQEVRTWSAIVQPDGSLASSSSGTQIGAMSNGTLGMVAAGAGVLVAGGDDIGTYMQAIAADGSPLGSPLTRSGDIAASVSLAASGLDGAIAFATVNTNGEIDARVIDQTGADSGALKTLVDASAGAGEFEIAPSAVGYAATYTDSSTSPNNKMIVLYNADFSIHAGPVAANTSAQGAENGAVGWAPKSHLYLAAWQDKDDTSADEVSFRLYDANLNPLATSAQIVMTNTGGPRITTDGTGFYVTARGYYPNSALVIDYIAADGTVTAIPDLDLNGNAEVWSAGSRAGQSGTAWIDGSVYLDVPCPP